MASKKCKGKIIFSNNRLRLNTNSIANINPTILSKNMGKVTLESWSDNDIFFGKNKSVLHIDYMTLELISHPSYSFESPLSNGSFYTLGFQKISDLGSFSCHFKENEILSGIKYINTQKRSRPVSRAAISYCTCLTKPYAWSEIVVPDSFNPQPSAQNPHSC